jgi:hypothetical protein
MPVLCLARNLPVDFHTFCLSNAVRSTCSKKQNERCLTTQTRNDNFATVPGHGLKIVLRVEITEVGKA